MSMELSLEERIAAAAPADETTLPAQADGDENVGDVLRVELPTPPNTLDQIISKAAAPAGSAPTPISMNTELRNQLPRVSPLEERIVAAAPAAPTQ